MTLNVTSPSSSTLIALFSFFRLRYPRARQWAFSDEPRSGVWLFQYDAYREIRDEDIDRPPRSTDLNKF